jgi:hypothetical protein
MIRPICFSILLLALAGLGLRAADIGGQWQAQVPGRDGNLMDTTFNFKVSGEQLAGTMENQYGERQISEGKVSGDDVSFTIKIEIGGEDITFLYKGKAAGNEIKFSRERKGGDLGPTHVEFVAKRKK